MRGAVAQINDVVIVADAISAVLRRLECFPAGERAVILDGLEEMLDSLQRGSATQTPARALRLITGGGNG